MQQIDSKGLDALALSLNSEAAGQGQGYQGEVTTSLSQRVGDSSKLPEVQAAVDQKRGSVGG